MRKCIISMFLLISPLFVWAQTSLIPKERLVGLSCYTYFYPLREFQLRDTAYFIYKGERGSQYDFNSMGYRYVYFDDPRAPFGFNAQFGVLHLPFHYDRNNTTLVQPDSFIFNWSHGCTGRNFFSYTDNNDIVTNDYVSGGICLPQQSFTRNIFADSNIIASVTYKSPLMIDTLATRYYFRDSSGRVLRDSTVYKSPNSSFYNTRYLYQYDSNGNIARIFSYISSGDTSPTTIPYYNYELTYSNNKLVKASTESLVSLPLPKTVTDSFIWNSDSSFFISEYSTDGRNGSLIKTKIISPVTGLPDTMFIINGGDSVNIIVYTYDAFRQPVEEKYIYHSKLSGRTDSLGLIVHYYYEKYDTIAIAPGPVIMSVYPNPTISALFISFTGITQATPFTLRLIDMAGRDVMRREVTYTSSPIELSVASLASGIYVLAAYDNTTNTRYIAKIARY